MYKIAVLPGDGIGPEIMEEGIKVLDKVSDLIGFSIEWVYYDYGAERYLRTGVTLSEDDLNELSKYRAIYMGGVGDPRVEPGILEIGIVLAIRFYFDEYINLRPIKLLSGVQSPLANKSPEDINFVVIRENTEDFYIGLGARVKQQSGRKILKVRRALYDLSLDIKSEFSGRGEYAYQIGVITEKNSERVFRFAFNYAIKHGLNKVSLVDKANVLPHVYGVWREAFEKVAKDYPAIETEMLFADATSMWFVKNPEKFRMVVMPNLFGDILTDLGAMIQGGLGLAPAGNINPKGTSMFEPLHGSAPKYKGLKVVNPIATILAGSMMLDYLGESEAAKIVENAVEEVLKEGKVRTRDLGGNAKTNEVGDAIVKKLSELF